MNRRQLISTVAFGAVATAFGRAATAAVSHEVTIKAFKFNPAELDVKVGDTVRFTNAGIAPHTATALDKSWDTGTLWGGKSADITVVTGMSGDYRCEIHTGMKGKLTIRG